MKNVLYATVALLSVACAGNGKAGPADRPAISGSWVLNEADSQNPLSLIGGGDARRGSTDPIIPGGDAPQPTRQSRARARAAAQLATSREKAEAVQQKLEVFIDMHRRITINDNGSAVNIAYAIGPQMSYRVGAKSPRDTVPVLGVVKRHAEWKDGMFIVEHEIGDLKLKEEFTRNVGSNRLFVYTTVKGLLRPLQYRRVYDPQ